MNKAILMAQMRQQVLRPDCVGAGDNPSLLGVWGTTDIGLIGYLGTPALGGTPAQGPHVLNLVSDSVGTDYAYYMGNTAGPPLIKGGRTYRFEAWAYVPSGQAGVFFNDARVQIAWADPDAKTATATSSAYDTWQRFQLTTVVLPGVTRYTIYLYNRGGTAPSPGGTIYFDKLSLTDLGDCSFEGFCSPAFDAGLFHDRMWNHQAGSMRKIA